MKCFCVICGLTAEVIFFTIYMNAPLRDSTAHAFDMLTGPASFLLTAESSRWFHGEIKRNYNFN